MGKSWGLIGLLALSGLAACTQDPLPPPTLPTRPQARVVAPQPPQVIPPSAQSEALALYYRRLQNDLLTQGLLRGDGGGPDTPFTDTQLAANFVRIALFDEYVSVGDTLRLQATRSRLRRWEQPIRMSVEFGASVPLEQRQHDTASVSAYAARLARITGLSIRQTNQNPNFHVLFLNEDDRLGYEDRLREISPNITGSSLRAIMELQRDQLCIVIAFSDGDSDSYSTAIALIRAEHPDLLRITCIHEELAQGLGLPNDSPAARPSIFNDDEEFGLLTTHDELLLKMLYDPRFHTGMTPNEAEPIARAVAREIISQTVGGGAS